MINRCHICNKKISTLDFISILCPDCYRKEMEEEQPDIHEDAGDRD